MFIFLLSWWVFIRIIKLNIRRSKHIIYHVFVQTIKTKSCTKRGWFMISYLEKGNGFFTWRWNSTNYRHTYHKITNKRDRGLTTWKCKWRSIKKKGEIRFVTRKFYALNPWTGTQRNLIQGFSKRPNHPYISTY